MTVQLGRVPHACNCNTLEVEAGGREVLSQPRVRAVLKKKQKQKQKKK
jgi:hypothetical protein